MWIDREHVPQMLDAARACPVVVVTGARQTGKSASLRRAFRGHAYVSLDGVAEAALAQHDRPAFFTRFAGPLIVDDVQQAPALLDDLPAIAQARRDQRGQLMITGSLCADALDVVAAMIGERIAVIDVRPLSFDEVLRASPATTLDAYRLRGGLPELWADPSIDAAPFYQSYVATYLVAEIWRRSRVASLRDFERFLRVCALRCGHPLGVPTIARMVGTTQPVVATWVRELTARGILELRSSSTAATHTLTFRDPGLLAYLLNARSPAEARSADAYAMAIAR